MYKIIDGFLRDHPEVIECNVKGKVPNWLEGSLYRNGPGKYRFGQFEGKHLFDGMAVVHRYIIKNGHIHYHNRLLQTDTLRRNKAANKFVVSEFGTVGRPDPNKSVLTRYISYLAETIEFTDNTNVNLMRVGDQLYAMTETHLFNELQPISLERVQKLDWQKLASFHIATAHPLEDADGTIYNMGTTLGPQCHYKIIKISPPTPGDLNPVKQVTVVASLPSQSPRLPSYFHSFGMTANYIIFIEQPLTINFLGTTVNRMTGKSFMDNLQILDGVKNKFHVVHKTTGLKIALDFVAKPFFVFHHINAYEDDCHIVVDVCAYEDTSVIRSHLLENLRKSEPMATALYKRFVLPLCINKQNENLVTLDYTRATTIAMVDGSVYCVPEFIQDAYIELPRINEQYLGKKYGYVYGVCPDVATNNKLVKIDLAQMTLTFWSEDGYHPEEPVFIASPTAEREDEGVILAPVLSLSDDKPSYLLILDAKSFTELARAELPVDLKIPISFHGLFTDFSYGIN